MPPTNFPTAIEELVKQVSIEYVQELARQKKNGQKEKIDFRQLQVNVLGSNNIRGSSVISRTLGEMSRFRAEKKKEQAGGQQSFRFRSVKKG